MKINVKPLDDEPEITDAEILGYVLSMLPARRGHHHVDGRVGVVRSPSGPPGRRTGSSRLPGALRARLDRARVGHLYAVVAE